MEDIDLHSDEGTEEDEVDAEEYGCICVMLTYTCFRILTSPFSRWCGSS